jgi:hypothetical protein
MDEKIEVLSLRSSRICLIDLHIVSGPRKRMVDRVQSSSFMSLNSRDGLGLSLASRSIPADHQVVAVTKARPTILPAFLFFLSAFFFGILFLEILFSCLI